MSTPAEASRMDGLFESRPAEFPPTRASLLELARQCGHPEYRAAWERFFRDYWPPLYSYLRRTGSSREEALDLLQDFFLAGLDGALLSRYEPGRGRLRAFLITCLRNLRHDVHRHEQARPDRQPYPFVLPEQIEATLEGASPEDAERVLEDDWARHTILKALAAVQAQLELQGDEVSRRILSGWVLDADRPPAAAFAATLGLTRGDLYTRATRLRQAIAVEVERQVRTYIGGTPSTAEERDEVLRRLPHLGSD